MSTYNWTVTDREALEERMHLDYREAHKYLEGYWDRPSPSTIRRYYGGLKPKEPRNPMYQDELDDLEKVYKRTLKNLHTKVEACLPALLHYMEEFLTLHKQNEAIREKLDVLLAKTGKPVQDECDGGDDE